MKVKNLMGATKSIPTNLKGVKFGLNGLKNKSNALPMNDIYKKVLKDSSKEVAKGLVLPAAGATAVGATAYGAKKSKEKTAFDIVNNSFDKIAKEKEDNVSTKFLRKNVTGRALGAAAVGGLVGGDLGAATSILRGNSDINKMTKYIKGGAAIGGTLLAANSIRKNVKHNRNIDAIDERLNKSAFDIVNDSFEKMAKVMPYTLPNGEYALPRDYRPLDEGENIPEDYGDDIPKHLKPIGKSDSDYLLVNPESDKNNPELHFYYPGEGIYGLADEYRDELYSTYNTKNPNAHKLTEKGITEREQVDSLDENALREFGYTKPTLKDTAKSVGRTAKRTLRTMSLPTLAGMGLGLTDGITGNLKKDVLIGAGLGAGTGLGLHGIAGGFKLDDTPKIRQNNLKKELKSDLQINKWNEDFLNQYKSASEIVSEVFGE